MGVFQYLSSPNRPMPLRIAWGFAQTTFAIGVFYGICSGVRGCLDGRPPVAAAKYAWHRVDQGSNWVIRKAFKGSGMSGNDLKPVVYVLEKPAQLGAGVWAFGTDLIGFVVKAIIVPDSPRRKKAPSEGKDLG